MEGFEMTCGNNEHLFAVNSTVCVCGKRIRFEKTEKFYRCTCGMILFEMHMNVVNTSVNCKRLYTIGNELLLVCLNCGNIIYDPTKIAKYKDKP